MRGNYFFKTMQLHSGIFLKSNTTLQSDPLFGNALIYIAEFNATGALGFILNRKHPRNFNELQAFVHCPALPLWQGGPMQAEQLFFLHCRPDLIEEAQLTANGIYLGGRFSDVVEALMYHTLPHHHIRLFIGYCGWDAGQLEQEIADGEWQVEAGQTLFGIDAVQ